MFELVTVFLMLDFKMEGRGCGTSVISEPVLVRASLFEPGTG